MQDYMQLLMVPMVVKSFMQMWILRLMCGETRNDRICSKQIHETVKASVIVEKMRENHLRWFGHIQCRSLSTPIKSDGINLNQARGRIKVNMDLHNKERYDGMWPLWWACFGLYWMVLKDSCSGPRWLGLRLDWIELSWALVTESLCVSENISSTTRAKRSKI